MRGENPYVIQNIPDSKKMIQAPEEILVKIAHHAAPFYSVTILRSDQSDSTTAHMELSEGPPLNVKLVNSLFYQEIVRIREAKFNRQLYLESTDVDWLNDRVSNRQGGWSLARAVTEITLTWNMLAWELYPIFPITHFAALKKFVVRINARFDLSNVDKKELLYLNSSTSQYFDNAYANLAYGAYMGALLLVEPSHRNANVILDSRMEQEIPGLGKTMIWVAKGTLGSQPQLTRVAQELYVLEKLEKERCSSDSWTLME